MSTRSTTHFTDGDESNPTAIIYRHGDGYPEGAGVDLIKFLKECKALPDSRLTDSSYLAAKYVVYLADMFNYDYKIVNGKLKRVRNTSKLDFLSVGVLREDPLDIGYRYVVDCRSRGNDGLPHVTCYSVNFDGNGKETRKEVVDIPQEEQEAS